MKKIVTVLLISLSLSVSQQSRAQTIYDIIKAAVVKAIKAADLKIQRQQNKIIWLQNAQKTLENTMSKLKLKEISDWVEKQRTLYKEYYDDLAKVKTIITYYQRIRDITEKQLKLLDEYKKAWYLFQQDSHFTKDELEYMARVYAGILDECAKNIDQIFLVVKSLTTTMSDAERLAIINAAADQADINYYDLVRFNNQNKMLVMNRAKNNYEVNVIKKLYGL